MPGDSLGCLLRTELQKVLWSLSMSLAGQGSHMTWKLGFHVRIGIYLPVHVEVGVPVKWLDMPVAEQR